MAECGPLIKSLSSFTWRSIKRLSGWTWRSIKSLSGWTWRSITKHRDRLFTIGVVIVVSVAWTLTRLLTTYDDFIGEAIHSTAVPLLLLLNVIMTLVVVFVVSRGIKPTPGWGKFWHIAIIALSFQALLSSDI